MRIAILAAAALLLGSLPSAATAQRAPDPIPIEEWSLEKVSRMGQEIYRHDVAAWVATDALLASFGESPPPAGMAGWIVVEDGDALKVRFLRREADVLKSAFDIIVRDGRAGPVEAVSGPLSAGESAQFLARQTAIANIGRLRCSPQMNAVVIPDPDSDEWLVWLLTPMQDDRIPIGGHYRFRISADGGTMLRRDQLSNTCFFAERPPEGQRENAMLFYTQIVSKGPVETHVFLSIQNQLTLVIGAGDRFYSVGGARVADITDMVDK
ncbi:MAG: hypothetical protein KL785_02125 [Brevundimonas sp.]|nr:hypothetical protein [Brevundimonas sp.]